MSHGQKSKLLKQKLSQNHCLGNEENFFSKMTFDKDSKRTKHN